MNARFAISLVIVGMATLLAPRPIQAQAGFQGILEKEVQKPIGKQGDKQSSKPSQSAPEQQSGPQPGTPPDSMELLEQIKNAQDAFAQQERLDQALARMQDLQEVDNRLEQLDEEIDQTTKDIETRRRQLEILMTQGDARERSKENIQYLRDELVNAINRKKDRQRERQATENRKQQLLDASPSDQRRIDPSTSSSNQAPRDSAANTSRRAARKVAANAEPEISEPASQLAATPSREQERVRVALETLRQNEASGVLDPRNRQVLSEYYRAHPEEHAATLEQSRIQLQQLKKSANSAESLMASQAAGIAREKDELKALKEKRQRLKTQREVDLVGASGQSDTDIIGWDETLSEIHLVETAIVDAEDYIKQTEERRERVAAGISQLQRSIQTQQRQIDFLAQVGREQS